MKGIKLQKIRKAAWEMMHPISGGRDVQRTTMLREMRVDVMHVPTRDTRNVSLRKHPNRVGASRTTGRVWSRPAEKNDCTELRTKTIDGPSQSRCTINSSRNATLPPNVHPELVHPPWRPRRRASCSQVESSVAL